MTRFAFCPHCGFFTRQLLEFPAVLWVCQVDPKHLMDVPAKLRERLEAS